MHVNLGIWQKLTRLVVILLVMAGLLSVAVWYRPLIQKNEVIRKRNYQLEAQIQREEQDIRRLRETIQSLQHDPKTFERVARERLNVSRPGEVVIRFEEPAAVKPPGAVRTAPAP